MHFVVQYDVLPKHSFRMTACVSNLSHLPFAAASVLEQQIETRKYRRVSLGLAKRKIRRKYWNRIWFRVKFWRNLGCLLPIPIESVVKTYYGNVFSDDCGLERLSSASAEAKTRTLTHRNHTSKRVGVF